MRRLTYRRTANRDIQKLLRHLARESGSVLIGRRFVDGLRARCRNLASVPGTMGVARNDLLPGLRSYVHRGYVILFRYDQETLIVVRIVEGHRDMPALFDDAP